MLREVNLREDDEARGNSMVTRTKQDREEGNLEVENHLEPQGKGGMEVDTGRDGERKADQGERSKSGRDEQAKD